MVCDTIGIIDSVNEIETVCDAIDAFSEPTVEPGLVAIVIDEP